MKLLTNCLAFIGAVVVILWGAGMVGVGDFRITYGPSRNEVVQDGAERWKRLASKTYMAYLMARNEDAQQVVIPKGARIENGWILPPDDFCAQGVAQCAPSR